MKKFLLVLVLCLAAFPCAVAMAGEPLMTAKASVDSSPEDTASGDSLEANLERELDLLLLGTVLHEPGEPVAIIQVGKTGEQGLYRLGDDVDGGRLTKILRDSITLTFVDIEVELDLAAGARGTAAAMSADTQRVQPRLRQTDGGFWLIERETLEQLGQAKELVHHATSLGAAGVRVDAVQADGLFHELGLQPGDIIKNMNGQVPDADRPMLQAMAQSVMGATMLRLVVERRGRMDILYYKIDP